MMNGRRVLCTVRECGALLLPLDDLGNRAALQLADEPGRVQMNPWRNCWGIAGQTAGVG